MAQPKKPHLIAGTTFSTRLESLKGALHAAEVESAYLALLREKLPDHVFAELDSMPMTREAVEAWAARHGIQAECVVQEFASYCNGGWTKYGKWRVDAFSSPEVPRSWAARVAELDAAGVSGDAFHGLADEHLVDGAVVNADRSVALQGIGTRRVKDAIRRHSRPIGADPALESLDQFIVRARRHWVARVKEAARYGLMPSTPGWAWGNMERDLQWLFWRDVEKHTVDEVVERWAREKREHVPADTVKKALRQLSKVLGLPARRGGRPKKRK